MEYKLTSHTGRYWSNTLQKHIFLNFTYNTESITCIMDVLETNYIINIMLCVSPEKSLFKGIWD